MPHRWPHYGSADIGRVTLAALLLVTAACADGGPPSRDPTIGEVGSTTMIGIGAASLLGGPLALGAAAAAGSTFVDPDTRVSELVSGGGYRHRPRLCQTLRDCVFSGRN